MDTIKFKCSKCGFEKNVPSQYSGKRVRCPKCQTENRVGQAVEQKAAPVKAVTKFNCPGCGQKMGVAVENVGKKVRCPQCKAVVTVPGPGAVSPQAKAPKAVPQVKLEEPEGDELRLSTPGMDDLLSMEKQAESVARLSSKPVSQRSVEEEATAELMRLQAKAAGRPEKQEEPTAKSGGVVMAACPIGAVCSVIIIIGLVMFLVISPPQRSFAAAERFMSNYMRGGSDTETEEPESDRLAAAPSVADSNAAEPNSVESSEDEKEPGTSQVNRPESSESSSGEDDITAATAAGSRTHGSTAGQPGSAMRQSMQRQARQRAAAEAASPYGPELRKVMAQEQVSLAEYLTAHEYQDVSPGAMERMSPYSTGVDHVLGLVYAEPSLTLVRKAQCYLPDTKEFGFALTYMPTQTAGADQMAVFILETRGDGLVIQGMRAKRTIFGWKEAMPTRASDIEDRANSMELVRKLRAIPGWYWYMGLPGGVAGVLIMLSSLWVLYEKVGRMGSLSLVPVYNLWVLAEVGSRPGWLSLLVTAAVVPMMLGGAMLYGALAGCMAIMLVISLGVASECGRGPLFAMGLWLLPCAFYPMLAAKIEG